MKNEGLHRLEVIAACARNGGIPNCTRGRVFMAEAMFGRWLLFGAFGSGVLLVFLFFPFEPDIACGPHEHFAVRGEHRLRHPENACYFLHHASTAPRTSCPILGGDASKWTGKPFSWRASEQVGPMEAT